MKETYKQNFFKAGALAKEVRAFGKSLIKNGASYNEVILQIRRKITELGALAAFPPQIALDYVAAHFLPQPNEEIIFTDQLVKLDVGICFNGAIGDCAVTIDLSGKYQKIIDAAEAALLAAEKSIHIGQPVREIGKIIQDTATSFGLQSVRNLSGHGLGYYKIHTAPSIPNYCDQSKEVIKPGMTFAIEPFVTNGKGLIYETDTPSIFSWITDRPVRSDLAKKLLIKIKTFKGLPFAIHDLIDMEFPLAVVNKAISTLVDAGVIAGYGPLIEEAGGMVAQAENSILVDENGKVFVTTR